MPGLVLARDPEGDAKALAVATGNSAVALREAILKDINAKSIVAKNTYAHDLIGTPDKPGPLLPLLDSKNPDAVVNAAIIIAEAQTLACDSALEQMLQNANPAVRYWGAKGLANIMPQIKQVGGATQRRAVDALNAALAKENSGVVKQQIINALGLANDASAVLKATMDLATQIQNASPDHETLDAAATALGQLHSLITSGTNVDKQKAAQAASWVASFSLQHEVALQKLLSVQHTGNTVPESYQLSVSNVVKAAVQVLNDLTGRTTFHYPETTDLDQYEFAINSMIGSPSSTGQLQKLIPGVPPPPAIKAPS